MDAGTIQACVLPYDRPVRGRPRDRFEGPGRGVRGADGAPPGGLALEFGLNLGEGVVREAQEDQPEHAGDVNAAMDRFLQKAEAGRVIVEAREAEQSGGDDCGRRLRLLAEIARGRDRILAEQLDSRNRPCNFVELMPRLREK